MNLIFDKETSECFCGSRVHYLRKIFKSSLFKFSVFVSLFCFFSFFFLFNAQSQTVGKLLSVDLNSKNNQSYEFFIETKNKPSCKSFTLQDPDRIVIDIGDVDNSTIFKAKVDKIATDSFIKNVRKGKFQDKIRVVFDLNSEGLIINTSVKSINKAEDVYKTIVGFKRKNIDLPDKKETMEEEGGSTGLDGDVKEDVSDLDKESKDILSDLANPSKFQGSLAEDVGDEDNGVSEVSWDKLISNEISSVAIDLGDETDSGDLDIQKSQTELANAEELASQPDTESTISDIISDIITENVGYEISDDGVRLNKSANINNLDTEEGLYYEISPNAVSDSDLIAPILKENVVNILKSQKMDETIIVKLKPERVQKPAPKLIFDNHSGEKSEVVSDSAATSVLVGRLSVEDIIEVKLKPKFVVMRKQPIINQRKLKTKPIIVIDAGHGGRDPGAIGRRGTREKDLTLLYAKTLKRELERSGKYQVYMTRNKDVFISLSGRVRRARKYKGDLFISIHADSSTTKNARGLSVYTLSEVASDKEAGRLARRENKVDIVAGANFKDQQAEILRTLIDLSQRETMNSSTKYASMLLKELQVRHASLKQQALRHAGFTVLSAPDIPSVLLEIGYLSNRREEKAMKTSAYRNKLVKSLSISIDKFFANRKVYY